MEKIYSKVEEGKLLHIVNRLYEIEGRPLNHTNT